jgi:hypothetical protein
MNKYFQAALKIQNAWRDYYYNTCPYCYRYMCPGIYNQYRCDEMWDKNDLLKLDIYLGLYSND